MSAGAARVRYRPAQQVLDVGLDAVEVPDVRQRIEILESIQQVKARRVQDAAKKNILENREEQSMPVENYVPVIGGVYNTGAKATPRNLEKEAEEEREREMLESRLLLGSEAEAQAYLAEKHAARAMEREVAQKADDEEARNDTRRPPLKANDPDPAKLTLDEKILADDNGIFKDELYPALRQKPRVVYVPDNASDNGETPFFQAKLIKNNPAMPGELLEVEVRAANLHMPDKKSKEPKIRGHKPSRSFIDRLAYEDMTEMEDYAKIAMANPDAHDVWKNPEMWSRNQELTYASYPRHPDYADSFRVLPPLKKGCGFCKGRFADKRLEPMNVPFIIRFLYPDGSIMRRQHTGCCKKHQKRISRTIKRARCMKIFTFKNGVFAVNTPYVIPKVWELHLDTLKVPNATKMDNKVDEQLVSEVYEVAFGKPFKPTGDLPSPAEAIAYEDFEEDSYPISDYAIDREGEAGRLHADKQRAADYALVVPKVVEAESARQEFLSDAAVESEMLDRGQDFAALDAKREAIVAKAEAAGTEEAYERAAAEFDEEVAKTAAGEEEDEAEFDEMETKGKADGSLSAESLETALSVTRTRMENEASKEQAAARKSRDAWQHEEETAARLLDMVRDLEVAAAKHEAKVKAQEKVTADAKRAVADGAQAAASLRAGLRPLNAPLVVTAGAAEEEAGLDATARRLAAKNRWWREAVANVDAALKDSAIATRLNALIDSAAAAATQRKSQFVRPTARAAALLLLLQAENRPPTERNPAFFRRLDAEALVLAREVLSLVGESGRPVATAEEVQSIVLDRLDAIKANLKTPEARAVGDALKERAEAISAASVAPTLADVLTATERDVAAAESPAHEALMLLRTLRVSQLKD